MATGGQNTTRKALEQMSAESKAEREHVPFLLGALAEKQQQADKEVNELRDISTNMQIDATMSNIQERLELLESQRAASPPHKGRVKAGTDGAPNAAGQTDEPMPQAVGASSRTGASAPPAAGYRRSGGPSAHSPNPGARPSPEVMLFEITEPLVRSRARSGLRTALAPGRTSRKEPGTVYIGLAPAPQGRFGLQARYPDPEVALSVAAPSTGQRRAEKLKHKPTAATCPPPPAWLTPLAMDPQHTNIE